MQVVPAQSVRVDRTGVLEGSTEYPGNLGAILRGAGFNISYEQTRIKGDGTSYKLEHGPTAQLVNEAITSFLGALNPRITEDQILALYRSTRAKIRAAHPDDPQLQQLLWEDVRDSVETTILHWEAKEGAL